MYKAHNDEIISYVCDSIIWSIYICYERSSCFPSPLYNMFHIIAFSTKKITARHFIPSVFHITNIVPSQHKMIAIDEKKINLSPSTIAWLNASAMRIYTLSPHKATRFGVRFWYCHRLNTPNKNIVKNQTGQIIMIKHSSGKRAVVAFNISFEKSELKNEKP